MGASPLLSDAPESDFEVVSDGATNSIETCLANVRRADLVIFVLSQRYGGVLKPPFPTISATHLEYRTAVEAKKPRHFYVRDRLLGEFNYWNKNGRKADYQGTWIKSASDHGLFTLFAEHMQLIRDGRAEHNNWFDSFTDSVELRALIRRRLAGPAARATAEQLAREGQVPFVVITHQHAHPASEGFQMSGKTCFTFDLSNLGPVPAFAVCCTLYFNGHSEWSPVTARAMILQANTAKTASVSFEIPNDQLEPYAAAANDERSTATLAIAYTTPTGLQYADVWLLHVVVSKPAFSQVPVNPTQYRLVDEPGYLRKQATGYRDFLTGRSEGTSLDGSLMMRTEPGGG